MQRLFDNFVQCLLEGVDEVDFREALAGTAAELGLEKFAYFYLPASKTEKPRLISNYPVDWTAHYLRSRYERIDPVILCARSGEHPFRWGSVAGSGRMSMMQKKLFDEAAVFGIRCGFTIPIPDRRGYAAAMTFASDEPYPSFLRVSEHYTQALQLISTCFHIHARRKLSSNRTIDGIVLTPREYECLQWAAKGKSAWEIGQILGIRRRTAAFHLDNARQKLGVRTIAQAVVRLASSHSSYR